MKERKLGIDLRIKRPKKRMKEDLEGLKDLETEIKIKAKVKEIEKIIKIKTLEELEEKNRSNKI